MDSRDAGNESKTSGTPEDVAALYAWANLHGAKYRDFSATRRESRAQTRHRAALALREDQKKAFAEAKAAANAAAHAALAAQSASSAESLTADVQAIVAQEKTRLLAESLARIEADILREEHEIAEAHAAADRQAQDYIESDVRRRQMAGRQPEEITAHGPAPLPGGRRSLSAGDDRPQAAFAQVPDTPAEIDSESRPVAPAWLFPPHPLKRTPAPPRAEPINPVAGLPPDSQERDTAEWSALHSVFGTGDAQSLLDLASPQAANLPLLLVFSPIGGVGKTSLAATLGRALSFGGERILIVDTTSHGLLPYYFGQDEFRSGAAHPLPTAGRNAGEPLSLISCDMMANSEDERRQTKWTGDILQNLTGMSRVVLDLSLAASWLIRRLAKLRSTVLVPITPDMNSVVSLRSIEPFFQGVLGADGRPLLPFYLLNRFDASLPLHLEVREVFRKQLGERLLQVSIRHSPAVTEALAEGMTVLEYAPDSAVAKDYLNVAEWLRKLSPSPAEGARAPSRSNR